MHQVRRNSYYGFELRDFLRVYQKPLFTRLPQKVNFMTSHFKAIRNFLKEEQGPTTVEYAVMLAMIVGVCIVSVVYLAARTGDSFDTSAGAISGATSN